MLFQPTPLVDVSDLNEVTCMCESCVKARYACAYYLSDYFEMLLLMLANGQMIKR